MIYASLFDPVFRPSVLKGHILEETHVIAGVTKGTLARLLQLRSVQLFEAFTFISADGKQQYTIERAADLYKVPDDFRARYVSFELQSRVANLSSVIRHILPHNNQSLWDVLVKRDNDEGPIFTEIFGNYNGQRIECVNKSTSLYRTYDCEKEPTIEEVLKALRNDYLDSGTDVSIIAMGKQTIKGNEKFFRDLYLIGYRYVYPGREELLDSEEGLLKAGGNLRTTKGSLAMYPGDYKGPGRYSYLSSQYRY